MDNNKQRERLVVLLLEVIAMLRMRSGVSECADYLLANGVIVPPCKIGDMVWAIRDYKGVKHPQRGEVSEMFFTKDMELQIVVKHVARGKFGKTVFLTEEEAQKALEGQHE